MANTTITPTKPVKHLGVYLDKNLTSEAHVQSVLDKKAKHVSGVMWLPNYVFSKTEDIRPMSCSNEAV